MTVPLRKMPQKLQRLAIGARSAVRFGLEWKKLVSLKKTYAKQKAKSLTDAIHHFSQLAQSDLVEEGLEKLFC